MPGGVKRCFVISIIGSEGSKEREWADDVYQGIIKDVTESLGYETIRADEISKSGIITSQVIQRLVEDELVVADLSFLNPNVFYELAVRHAYRKPYIQLIRTEDKVPFDVSPVRTITYDKARLIKVNKAKDELRKNILEIEANPDDVENPLTSAVASAALRDTSDPTKKGLAQIINLQETILGKLDMLTTEVKMAQPPHMWNLGELYTSGYQLTIDPSTGHVVQVNPPNITGSSGWSGGSGYSVTPPKDAVFVGGQKVVGSALKEENGNKKGRG